MIPSAATMAPPGPKTGIAKQHWPEGPCAGLIATPRWRVAASYFRNGAEMAGHRSLDPGTPPSARWRALPGGEKANRTRPSAVEGDALAVEQPVESSGPRRSTPSPDRRRTSTHPVS
jgi:hypothetical protein